MANLSLKKPFSDNEKGYFVSNGAALGEQLEPHFEKLWQWIEAPKNSEFCTNIR